MTNDEKLTLGEDMFEYVKKFNIPLPYLFEILEDQKVTPMIRGKAMEYNAYLLLNRLLPKNIWSVQKLNLNAQPGVHDEDISITHRRTGIILKVESKSAVRGSITDGKRTRRKLIGFCVKCHRSRSNMKLAKTSNDRYHVSSFDVLITNSSNAIYQGNTLGENLEIIHNDSIREMLFKFYNVNNEDELRQAAENDWRYCIPTDIAENDYIPRNPFVTLENDQNWKPITQIEQRLLEVVDDKRKRHIQTASRRF